MKQIFNNLWLGDYDDLKKYSKKKRWVILYVGGDEMFEKRTNPVAEIYVIPIIDDSIKQDEVLDAISILDDILCSYESKVLVCCDAGMSRSPYIVARWISKRLNCSIDTAYKMLKAVYPQADENTPLRVNDEVVE